MVSVANSGVRQSPRTAPRTPAAPRVPANPFAVACLVFFFTSSGLAVIAGQILGRSLAFYFLLVVGPAAIWLAKMLLGRRTMTNAGSRRANLCLAWVCFFACLSATAAVFDPALSSAATQICVRKTAGLVFTCVMLATSASTFTIREVVYALIGFAIIESVVFLLSTFLLDINLNPNAVSVRLATCGLLLFACLPQFTSRILGWFGWLGSIAITFILQCRTSAVASVGAIGVGYFEPKTRRARSSILVLGLIAGSMLAVLGDDITAAARSIAVANLKSTNPIAKFFLSDKSYRDVSGDFFDRGAVWLAAIRRIEDRPLLGYGFGAEAELFEARSHNAYLSLLVEGGIGLLFGWLLVYGTFVAQASHPRWIERYADGPIGKSQVLLFSYMGLAALVESAGIGSIGTPNNMIFLFLTLWIAQRLAIPALKPSKPSGARLARG